MKNPMMKCGHAANAVNKEGLPCCAICAGLTPNADIVDENFGDRLEGRMAICPHCKKTVPSSLSLAFFEYRGSGSKWEENCKNCGIFHKDQPVFRYKGRNEVHCSKYEPRVGGFELDLYYCGCRGWD